MASTDAEVQVHGSTALEVMVQSDETVLVRGRLTLEYSVPCARCLDPSTVDAGAELCVTYVPAAKMRAWLEQAHAAHEGDEEGIPLEPDDLDQVPYEGRSLDLRGLISEQALLAYPMRQLCVQGEDCRGLCAGCGHNFNQSAAQDGRCPHCNRALDASGGADDAAADTPWKRALAGLRGPDQGNTDGEG
jgi:uncharacterized metal-binding protein YceD (DUF177 family)